VDGIYGTSLKSTQLPLEPAWFPISAAPVEHWRASMAGGGETALLVFEDTTRSTSSTRKISLNLDLAATIIDPKSVAALKTVSFPLTDVYEWNSTVFFDGQQFQVGFDRSRLLGESVERRIYQPISTGGTFLAETAPIWNVRAQAAASAFNGDMILTLWTDGSSIHKMRHTLAGQALDMSTQTQLERSPGPITHTSVPHVGDDPRLFSPGIAVQALGTNFVAAWGINSRTFDKPNLDIHANIITPSGERLLAQHAIVADGPQLQFHPRIASNGRLAILVWRHMVTLDDNQIRAAIISADGTVRLISSPLSTGNAVAPIVAWLPQSGAFAIAWAVNDRASGRIEGVLVDGDGSVMADHRFMSTPVAGPISDTLMVWPGSTGVIAYRRAVSVRGATPQRWHVRSIELSNEPPPRVLADGGVSDASGDGITANNDGSVDMGSTFGTGGMGGTVAGAGGAQGGSNAGGDPAGSGGSGDAFESGSGCTCNLSVSGRVSALPTLVLLGLGLAFRRPRRVRSRR